MTAPALYHGPYRTPRVRIGKTVLTDEARGLEVVVVGLTDARIMWPVGKPKGGRAKGPVVFGDLERAVRLESNLAVCYHFGVTPQTVSKWRKALGVGRMTYGTKILALNAAANNDGLAAARDEQHELQRDPLKDAERREKIRLTNTGKFRKWSTNKKIMKAKRGVKASTESRAKMSATHKARRSFLHFGQGREWTAEEDEVIRTERPRKAVVKLERSLSSVYSRRCVLGVRDGRTESGALAG